MTARVCPVHGEYAADGVCRWCEQPKPSGADQSTITLPLGCICQKCLRMFDAPIPLTSLLCPECRGKARESAIEKAAREYFATSAGMRPLGSTLRRYSTPEGVASHAAFWEAKLAKEHAALRWERVARRLAGKHGPWMLLDFAQHWQFFLNRLIDRREDELLRGWTNQAFREEPKP